VHEGWRLFFGGLETVTLPDGETFEANYSPMEFAEPGEERVPDDAAALRLRRHDERARRRHRLAGGR
jgi:hypothetical protein